MRKNFNTISAIASAIFGGILLCASCSRTVYVPVESYRIDSISQRQLHVDTIETRDSVIMYQRGDTLIRDRVKYAYRIKWRHDTLMRLQRDTIRIPIPTQTISKAAKPSFTDHIATRILTAISLITAGLLLAAILKKR